MENETRNILEQNCRLNWPEWTCYAANICGLISTTMWFLVLLPQVWKNFRRKSVVGLSALWATANFTASLISIFFVYMYAKIPLYGKINSVYMPILEFTILVQFWIYGTNYPKKSRIIYTICCFILWSTIITLQLSLRRFPDMQWIAIGLWCIETFPQVILNLRRHSTSGQATKSVCIALIGKTTDFLANYGLVLPIQNVVMIYFSSSVAYINGIQVIWYYQQHDTGSDDENTNGKSDRELSQPEEVEYSNGANSYLQNDDVEYTPLCSNVAVRWKKVEVTRTNIIRWILMTFLSAMLVLFAVGLVWNTKSAYGLIGPFSIGTVVSVAYIIINNKHCKGCKNLICR